MSVPTFGGFIKELRLNRRISLRTFSETIGWDAGNYSKLERGKLPAPTDPAKLEPIRKALDLHSDSEEWRELIRLSSLSRGEVPPRVLSDQELLGKLPALFRTLEGDAIDESVLEELIATLRRSYNGSGCSFSE